jgi:group I intron endonuclease
MYGFSLSAMNTYKATNTLNGNFYIGSTTNFEKRKKGHLNSKENYPFQNSLRRNPEVFEWEVWSDDSDEPLLEQALLDMWFGKECCYNLCPYAHRPPDMTGKKMWVNGEGAQTFSANSPGEGWNLGVNEERKEQNSRAKKGKKEGNETREKKSRAHKGRKRVFTEEHCANISKSRKGKKGDSRGGLIAGRMNAELGRGFCNPEYRSSEKYLIDRERARKIGAEVTSRLVSITFADGTVQEFQSLSQASRFTGMTGQSLGSLAKSGKMGSKGKYSGIRVQYLEG